MDLLVMMMVRLLLMFNLLLLHLLLLDLLLVMLLVVLLMMLAGMRRIDLYDCTRYGRTFSINLICGIAIAITIIIHIAKTT